MESTNTACPRSSAWFVSQTETTVGSCGAADQSRLARQHVPTRRQPDETVHSETTMIGQTPASEELAWIGLFQ